MGFAKLRVGHAAGAHKHYRRATPNSSCKTGGFYQAPTTKQSLDSLKPLEIKWDTTCLDTQKADIYLYAPTAAHSRVAVWQNVDFTAGSVTVDLMPRWWNSTASMNLQLGIVPSGQAPFQVSDLPAGPVFTATYTNPTSGNPPPAADTSIKTSAVINMDQKLGSDQTSHGMSSGKTAAAVLLPLLLIIGCVIGYIRWQRKKASGKSQRFSVAVDKRMSTISTDWKSVTAAGANAAIRNSMAVSGNRASSFSFGGIRPASSFALDDGVVGNQAGVGARQMSQMRTGVGLRNPPSIGGERMSRVSFADGVRQSRVSFANDPRPSVESRRTRAFHHDHAPPVPSIPAAVAAAASSDEDGALSPRQTHGPLALTPEDIRARIAAGSRARSASNASTPAAVATPAQQEIDDVLPALSMMRTDQGEDYLLPAPAPAHTHAAPPTSIPSPPPTMMSPVMATMPLPMPASVMSPDEMLRAYAERRSTRTMTPVNGVSYPMSVASPMSPTMSMPIPMPMSPPPAMAMTTPLPMSPVNTGNGVRPLFGLTGVMSPTNTGNGHGHGRMGSVAVGQYGGARYEIGEDEDAYGGTA